MSLRQRWDQLRQKVTDIVNPERRIQEEVARREETARRQRELEAMTERIEDYLAEHPSLAPERHGIPDRYAPVALRFAIDAIDRLLSDVADRLDSTTTLHLFADGTICSARGIDFLSAHRVRSAISKAIAQAYIPDTSDPFGVFRAVLNEPHRIATTGLIDAQHYIRWIVKALEVDPYLLRGFQRVAHDTAVGACDDMILRRRVDPS